MFKSSSVFALVSLDLEFFSLLSVFFLIKYSVIRSEVDVLGCSYSDRVDASL